MLVVKKGGKWEEPEKKKKKMCKKGREQTTNSTSMMPIGVRDFNPGHKIWWAASCRTTLQGWHYVLSHLLPNCSSHL